MQNGRGILSAKCLIGSMAGKKGVRNHGTFLSKENVRLVVFRIADISFRTGLIYKQFGYDQN